MVMIICKSDAELGWKSETRLSGTQVQEDQTVHYLSRVLTGELHQMTDQYHRSQGAVSSFTGYHGFPASICTSVDEPKVHGLPSYIRLFAMSYDGRSVLHFCEGEMRR